MKFPRVHVWLNLYCKIHLKYCLGNFSHCLMIFFCKNCWFYPFFNNFNVAKLYCKCTNLANIKIKHFLDWQKNFAIFWELRQENSNVSASGCRIFIYNMVNFQCERYNTSIRSISCYEIYELRVNSWELQNFMEKKIFPKNF